MVPRTIGPYLDCHKAGNSKFNKGMRRGQTTNGMGSVSVEIRFDPNTDLTSRQFVGRVARSSRNIRQPNHVFANSIVGHKAERRPGAGEEWLAMTKHDRVDVELILINKTEVG